MEADLALIRTDPVPPTTGAEAVIIRRIVVSVMPTLFDAPLYGATLEKVPLEAPVAVTLAPKPRDAGVKSALAEVIVDDASALYSPVFLPLIYTSPPDKALVAKVMSMVAGASTTVPANKEPSAKLLVDIEKDRLGLTVDADITGP